MRITSVTTKVGDGGDTFLAGGQKVSKDDPRIEAYGTIDELNSVLGLALAEGLDATIAPSVCRVQNELFRLGCDLCLVEEDRKKRPVPGIEERHVVRLDEEIGRLLESLPPLEEFVLPGGSRGAAQLHVARTVCRRAERLAVKLSHKEWVGPVALKYLNRLSDWLFVLARAENRARGRTEPQWDKGI